MFLTPTLVLVCLANLPGPFVHLPIGAPDAATAPGAGAGAPVCNAGGPYFAECQNGMATVTLDGTGSFDPNGGPLQFKWRIECGPAVMTNANTATPTVTIDMTGLCDAPCGRVDLMVRN